MTSPARIFRAEPAKLEQVPILTGIIGPPGGGKTVSSLRLAKGMQRVRPGPVVMVETERKRASKYADKFDFLLVEFNPPFVPEEFLSAVLQQLPANPAAIIIDSLSDEHEGEGGVLDWHDKEVPNSGGNQWAAWSKPKRSRQKMINGFLQIKTPLIFTFRAREKTKLVRQGNKDVPVNIGYQPIAPSEVIYALDLTCILPPRANGVPVWKSNKVGEDFIIKLPSYLAPLIGDGELNEDVGERLARWAMGTPQKTSHDAAGRAAALRGSAALKAWWQAVPKAERSGLEPLKNELKSIAEKADEEFNIEERDAGVQG